MTEFVQHFLQLKALYNLTAQMYGIGTHNVTSNNIIHFHPKSIEMHALMHTIWTMTTMNRILKGAIINQNSILLGDILFSDFENKKEDKQL